MQNKILLFLILLCILSACKNSNTNPTAAREDAKWKVVATTGMIGDAVKNIAGDKVLLEVLMGPGVDPHLYKASHSDLEKLNKADIVFYNGLYLEGKMEEILQKIGRTKKAVAVAEQIDKSKLIRTADGGESHLSYDPHIWFDVALWAEAVSVIAETLKKADSTNAEFYQNNFEKYSVELKDLHQWLSNEISKIPQEQRLLITSHDAFSYFGRAYNIDVEGLQGISTASDYGLSDVTRIVDLIVERKIKAVFIETSVSEKPLMAVLKGCEDRGHKIDFGGNLFSDAMGSEGTSEGTYIGMVQHNVNTIVNALK